MNKIDKSKLLPCIHCGSEPVIVRYEINFDPRIRDVIQCSNKKCHKNYVHIYNIDDPSGAINEWNLLNSKYIPKSKIYLVSDNNCNNCKFKNTCVNVINKAEGYKQIHCCDDYRR